MEDFVTFEIAKKLKEKGFSCEYPFAMYNEGGVFHELYTSVGNMQYYDYDDFDERDTIAPTISQALKWLREENEIYINIVSYFSYAPKNNVAFAFCARYKEGDDWRDVEINLSYLTYEECALAGIEYVLDNLI